MPIYRCRFVPYVNSLSQADWTCDITHRAHTDNANVNANKCHLLPNISPLISVAIGWHISLYLESCAAARSTSGCWGSCWESQGLIWPLMMRTSPHWLGTGLEGCQTNNYEKKKKSPNTSLLFIQLASNLSSIISLLLKVVSKRTGTWIWSAWCRSCLFFFLVPLKMWTFYLEHKPFTQRETRVSLCERLQDSAQKELNSEVCGRHFGCVPS